MGSKESDLRRRWQRTARARLKFELAGLTLARKAGFTPEDYASHLWSTGASKWIGKALPTAKEYLLKEAEAFRTLYPEVCFELGMLDNELAELTFTDGCLGGWGQDQWAIARNLGLVKQEVCGYCRQAFRTWASQLGLEVCPEPQANGQCIFRVSTKG